MIGAAMLRIRLARFGRRVGHWVRHLPWLVAPLCLAADRLCAARRTFPSTGCLLRSKRLGETGGIWRA